MLWQRSSRKQLKSKKTNDKKLYDYAEQIQMEKVVLKKEHKPLVRQFRCGNKHIDEFVRRYSCKEKETVTYAIIDTEKNLIISIMTLVASGVYSVHGKHSKRPNIVIPAVEIKYFATDERYQKMPISQTIDESLSYAIFTSFMKDILDLSNNTIGIQKVVLYAVEDAITFYQRFKFKNFRSYMARSNARETKGCTPMYFSLH